MRIKNIHGRFYGVSQGFGIFERQGVNQWISHCAAIPSKASRSGDDFDDLDGFSADILYAAGGKGHVFTNESGEWVRCPFPSNMYLHALCCTPNGDVYIGAQSGTVFKGRGNEWKMIHRGALSLPFKDMVWHAGRVWCTNDYGLWCIEDDQLVEASIPDAVRIGAGHLAVGDGVMLMAGYWGAALHDGECWTVLFNLAEYEAKLPPPELRRF